MESFITVIFEMIKMFLNLFLSMLPVYNQLSSLKQDMICAFFGLSPLLVGVIIFVTKRIVNFIKG